MSYREAADAKGTPRSNPDEPPDLGGDMGTKGTCTPNVPDSSAPPDPAADPGYWNSLAAAAPADDDSRWVDFDEALGAD